DRKSTRLNSSHVEISYAVFCLKKKQTCALRSEEHTSELQSRGDLVCRLLLEKTFKKYHLTVPSTWAQFAADAAQLHSEAPGVYLGLFFKVNRGHPAPPPLPAGALSW